MTMRNTEHATLAHGGYRYVYEDGTGYRCTATRPRRSQAEVAVWTHDLLPGLSFESLDSLRDRVHLISDEDAASERAQYPRLLSVEVDTCSNRCRLCPRQPGDRFGRHHDTLRVHLQTSWQHRVDASLCRDHAAQFTGKPADLVAALNAEVAARKAAAAARGFPW